MASTIRVPTPPLPAGAALERRWGEVGWKRALVSVVLLAAVVAVALTQVDGPGYGPDPVVYGFVALGLFLGVAAVVEGTLNPLRVAMGQDGRLSTSKFQFFFWTAVVGFSYGWLYAARAERHLFSALGALPHNVLIAMGFSVATMTGAKAITTAHVSSGALSKPPQDSSRASVADLVTNDDAAPDLPKIQMLFWTFVAATVYLVTVSGAAHAYAGCVPAAKGAGACSAIAFPDIDSALMVLMGLGQGAYVGTKLVPSTAR